MFSWFNKFFTKSKKSSCCSKNVCGANFVCSDTSNSLANSVVINTIANSICMDQGHPMYCTPVDSSPSCESGSSCCGSTSDSPSGCDSGCDSDCSSSCDSGSSCCGSSD